ncbi:MAG: HPr kinase/phosphorylase [Pararhodobacter sp.]
MSAPAHNLHASTVAFGPTAGVLILGPSGAGKSRLAMALIGLGAQLVADDQTLLASLDDALYARAPRAIAGLLEVRGVGLIRLLPRRLAQVALVVDLGAPAPPRLPEPQRRVIAGIALPCLAGPPGGPSPDAVKHYIQMSCLKGQLAGFPGQS